ncbi:DUF2243 domain-containing protein [Rhodococcus sp. NPDC047139]|uniref:DUF2243 domain-containing protein n=1 Tax=Rhodococcus sp. NPDC047139 TaxID=3155141 RepID=UPI0033D298BE
MTGASRPVSARDGISVRHSAISGALLGVALMAAVDEIVFHQILGWHHFYDRSTPAIGLASDGLLHTAELLVLVAGFALLADVRRRHALAVRHFWAALLLGAGGFQLFDGLVNHKVFRIHQIRYDVDVLPYDLAWIAGAVVFLIAGAVLWWSTKRTPRTAATTDG